MESKPTISYEEFSKVELRVATIIKAELHPNADRLLKLQIDLGDEQRQICAGIKAFYEPEQLTGKQVVIVANLAPRRIRGELSNGMLLAANVMDESETSDVVIAELPKQVPNGVPVI